MNKWILVLGVAAGFVLAGGVARADDAKTLYDKNCASCHGKDGKGDTKMGKKLKVNDYTDAAVQAEMKDDEMARIIKEGVKGDDGKTRMKGYADKMSEDDVKGLVAYIRAFKK